MPRFLEALQNVTPIVWQASWQAACLAVLIWAVVMLCGDRIAARSRFVLCSLVFIRLALPVVPTSPTSVFRLSPATTAPIAKPDVDKTATVSSPVDGLSTDGAQPDQPCAA